MDALLQPDQVGTDLVRLVLERLFQVGEGALSQVSGGPVSPGRPNYFHHPLIEPCLEVMGHWATGCNGVFVPLLLAATPATTRVSKEISLLPILQKLFEWGHRGLLQVVDYLQLLWVSGCLVCDAGIWKHPSTQLAAPILLPLLSMSLHEHENAITSGVDSLECKREAVMALWNGLNSPPRDSEEQCTPQQDVFQHLLELVLTGSPSGDIDAKKLFGDNTIAALTNLLSCPDADVMLASLQTLNALLRNVPSTRVSFMEANGEEALEAVCDLPLGNDSTSNMAADIAADLIDFFGDDQFDDLVLEPPTAGGVFVFGLQNAASAPAPIFLPDLQSGVVRSSILPPVASVGVDPMAPSAMGRGRGRGRSHTLPAWALEQR